MSYDVNNSMGTISVALSNSLMTFNNQQAAVDNFTQQPSAASGTPAQQPLSGPPVSVNAWTHLYDQMERGIIATNLVV